MRTDKKSQDSRKEVAGHLCPYTKRLTQAKPAWRDGLAGNLRLLMVAVAVGFYWRFDLKHNPETVGSAGGSCADDTYRIGQASLR
jgi:hypothetical protein